MRRIPEIAEVYASQALRTTGLALVSIFVPIYLLTLGYSLEQALLFVMVHYSVSGMVSVLAGYLNWRLGLKKTALIAAPFTIGYFLSLYALSYTQLHFLVPAVLIGFGSTLHWMPMHCLFTRGSSGKTRGRQVSIMQSSRQFFQILAPGLGGMIAAIYGFPALMIAAFVVVTAATLPLFMTPDMKSPQEFRLKDLVALRHHSLVGVSLAEGFVSIIAISLLPLYIYLVLDTTTTVGYLKSLESLVGTLGVLAVGQLLDRKTNRKRWLRTASVLLAIVVGTVPLFTTTTGLAAVAVLVALAGALYFTSFNTILYDTARELKDQGDEFIIVRELLLNTGRVTTLGLAIILPFTTVFPIAATALLIGAIAYRT